jgi:hypothetical protein
MSVKTSGGNAPLPKQPARAITTSTMKRVEPPRPRKSAIPVSQANDTDTLIEELRQRVNELETRLSDLESVISVQNQDVVISSPKSVLIQGLNTVEITAGSNLKMSAALSECSVPIAKFSGFVQCEVIQANTVMGASYTPGAGNIW